MKNNDPDQLDRERLVIPELPEQERKQAEERTALRAAVIHEAIRIEGDGELRRPVSALAWSSWVAGLSMGFSMLAEGLLQAHLPNTPWRPIITKFGYTVGFLMVILGRQQLFTENTLTAIIPLFARRDLKTLWKVIRLWIVVLTGNIAGALAFAATVSHSNIVPPQVHAAFTEIGFTAITGSFGTIFIKAVFAGWLIAAMVWMMPVAESGIAIVIVMTYLVGLGEFQHVIVVSIEVLFLVTSGAIQWTAYLACLVPTLMGNIVGGVLLVAFFNHAQVVSD
jgi:formate-nitrite transporter family protein